MTREELRGHWNELRGRIEERWSQLSSDDLDQVDGNIDQLVGVLQQKTGQARQNIERELNTLLEGMSDSGAGVTEQMGEYVKQAKNYLAGAGETVRDQYGNVAAAARDRYQDVENQVRRHPTESVAVAFGTGLIAGIVVGLVLRSR